MQVQEPPARTGLEESEQTMKLRQDLNDIADMLDKLVKALCAILLTAMVIVVTLQIFSRYIMPKPLPWTEEVSRFCMVWLAFLGSSCLVRTWENTAVTFFLDKFSPGVRYGIELAIKIVMLLFVVWLVWLGVTELPRISLNEKSPALMMSMFIPKSSIVFGCIFIAVQIVLSILDTVLKRKEERNG